MSTIPTEITAATEGSLDIASIKSVMDGFDPASLLPDLSKVFGSLVGVCRVAVMIGPVIALILGLAYLFLAPKEANYYFGYRCYFGMGSVRAWRFTQRIAGMILGGLGLILTVIMAIVTALGGIGATTGLFPALTLGCGAVGGSSSSNNISPLDLINIRRVAWDLGESPTVPLGGAAAQAVNAELVELLTEKILQRLGE